MTMISEIKISNELTEQIAKNFGDKAQQYDQNGTFVADNYQDLKEHNYFAALIPQELGGQGLNFPQMADQLRIIGQQCGSTALALSMHSHLVAANVWKYKQGHDVAATLKKIAAEQPVLVSTGAKDWLDSNGGLTKVEGGYLLNAVKHFASQSAVGDIMITSAVYEDAPVGPQVLHFPVPFKSVGVEVMNNWNTMGMRGTGSHSIKLEDVFVPDSAIALSRPQGEFHPVWNVVLTVAMPLIMAVYLGIAQRAAQIALQAVKRNEHPRDHQLSAMARLNNELTSAELNWQDMVRINNNFDFKPENELGHQILTRKSNVAQAVIKVVTIATEVVGGTSYFKSNTLERLFRDIQGAKYHPLQEAEQLLFSGKHLTST